ncbi:hypothetical protein Q5H92_13110 [Hymenobacter sp. M29]|uniref:Uncharacterized protein n=1 Tax=Hymenobacter mellowenesis TaxID=3063995 RepID=A0ABT9ABT3_9BACT|nr:hypothetical protein [Hymenobacter sp. M29]MDO7847305.1 hypothetical protein [Hymenobacter sp. M29]
MTTADRELLMHFVVCIDMHIHPVTTESAINFIHGYEAGTRGTCDLTKQLRQRLTSQYRLSYSNDGWWGQLQRLAQKQASTWLILFRRLALELIVEEQRGRLNPAQQVLLKARIVWLVERLESRPFTPPDPRAVENWLSLCAAKSEWFQQLWTQEEWGLIQRADAIAQAQGPSAHASL